LHASVIDITGISGLDNDARKFMVDECNQWGSTACVAFVTNSVVSRMVGNLFLTISKLDYPVKLFKDVSEAQI
jgi:hypothetical protein